MMANDPQPGCAGREEHRRHEDDRRWAALMAAAQDGDRAAYGQLLAEILPFLRAVARRRLFSAADVEDAVQDTLLTIHQIRHTYDPQRPIRPWLRAIAEHRVLDRARVLARRARREGELGVVHHETLIGSPTNEGEARIEGSQVRAAVAGLPAGQRQAIELLKLGGLSLAEAAARTGLSVTALKVATHRAMRTLRARITGSR